ncbi:hypothetical protein FDP41_002565 [Naegleria fowleri]|uniref:N,N'-diacetylchitobiose phosphorylase n=1 Tax=Naegleria fowleri TaxID=5763 RepID=A0A6A5BZJ0_NAEFO|nr:uncharacterized protein FDP41_002565 [Naegleria fowleri]KAF0978745.1 hypothetical protein FDP41_002565 [Naegleria fowleri]
MLSSLLHSAKKQDIDDSSTDTDSPLDSPNSTKSKKVSGIRRNASIQVGLSDFELSGTNVPNPESISLTHLSKYAITLAGIHEVVEEKKDFVKLIKRLDETASIITQAHDIIYEAIMQNRRITSSDEWLVDNFWMIKEQIHMAKKHLPLGYEKEMPKLNNTKCAGYPRIYGIVFELINLVNGQITEENIFQFVKSYQSVKPLTIGECWGLGVMLRLGLLENIRRVADGIISRRQDCNLADAWADRLLTAAEKSSRDVVQILYQLSQSEPIITNAFVLQISQRLQGSDPVLSIVNTWLEQQLSIKGIDIDQIFRMQKQANSANQVTMSYSINSLRLINNFNWKEFVEKLSHLEVILRKDPSNIYPMQNFQTRDRCRHSVERIAKRFKLDEKQVANKALALARENHEVLQSCVLGSPRGRSRSNSDVTEPSSPGGSSSPTSNSHSLSPRTASNVIKNMNPDQMYDMKLIRRKACISYWLLEDEGLMELHRAIGFKLTPLPISWVDLRTPIFLLCILLLTCGFAFSYITYTTTSYSTQFNRYLPFSSLASYSGSSYVYFMYEKYLALILLYISVILVGSQFAVNMTNMLFVRLKYPASLPSMDFSLTGIPDEHRSIVVVPTMITNADGIKELMSDLQGRYLINRDKNILFALITDFADSKTETTEKDDELVKLAVDGINELNRLYPRNIDEQKVAKTSFFLFHRKRLYNPVEKVWMGWERKRGKLAEFNRYILHGEKGSFSHIIGDTTNLHTIKHVITLDTDTMLPSDAARNMIETAAHVLNEPVIDHQSKRVTHGYGLLQPRVSVGFAGSTKSLYAYMHSLDSGLDPYTREVSDVYQDTFGEGSFIGKGLYNVETFEKVLGDKFPENRILSHDLIEGCFVRSALVSHVEVIEDYPSSYGTEASRRHRWIRGDWQIASYAFSPWIHTANGYEKNTLTALHRWKIFDNLRRSLVPAAMTYLIMCTALFTSYHSKLPLVAVLSVLSLYLIPTAINTTIDLVKKSEDITWRSHLKRIRFNLMRSFVDIYVELVFTPFEAYNNIDAIIRCLYRLYFSSGKGLLEWTTFQAASNVYKTNLFLAMSRLLWFPVLLTTSIICYIIIQHNTAVTYSEWQLSGYAKRPLILTSNIITIILLFGSWIVSPFIAYYLSKPLKKNLFERETVNDLTVDDKKFLQVLSRRTWRFFETFVREEDNYLPLDNYQDFPKPMLARRTSPTNIGLALLSNLGAYDFGFITNNDCIVRTHNTLSTLCKMDRYKGHFYNWYDTQDLRPLWPKYISSVDSGNLVGHLLVLKSGLSELTEYFSALNTDTYINGLRGNLYSMEFILQEVEKTTDTDDEELIYFDINEIRPMIDDLHTKLSAKPTKPTKLIRWYTEIKASSKKLEDVLLESLNKLKKAYKEDQQSDIEWLSEDIEERYEKQLLFYAQSFVALVTSILKEMNDLTPFLKNWELPEEFSAQQQSSLSGLLENESIIQFVKEFNKVNVDKLTVQEIAGLKKQLNISTIRKLLSNIKVTGSGSSGSSSTATTGSTSASSPSSTSSTPKGIEAIKRWTQELEEALTVAEAEANRRIKLLKRLINITENLIEQDFSFLYNPSRDLLVIGYNVEADRIDQAHYDMFCSEARLISYVGIALGYFPVKHWFSMSRLITTQGTHPALLSWSGSVFEYLLPLNVMPNIPGTLLDSTYHAVVLRQIEYGKQKNIPWGQSESAYNLMDANLVYQYGPFGVPGLGLKRGLSNDLVVAPYATTMCLMILPKQATKNLRRLTEMGLLGCYGMFESVDFTPHRLRGNIDAQPIKSFFAHHSGMSFLSLVYCLRNQPMQRRFMAVPEFGANILLLQEKIPTVPHISNPNEKETERWKNVGYNLPSANRQFHGLHTYPEVHMLSNHSLHVMVTVNGGGYIKYKDMSITRWREDATLDGFGVLTYFRDLKDKSDVWSATSTPIKASNDNNYSVTFSQARAEFKRLHRGITTDTIVTVSPLDDVEVRRVRMTNNTSQAKEIEFTSYGEIVLNQGRADAAHRAFSNLFVGTEILHEQNAILFYRKQRDPKDKKVYGFHILHVHEPKNIIGERSFETDRSSFLGRGYTMQRPKVVCDEPGPLSNTAGFPLDPIFSIRQGMRIKPGRTVHIDYITGVAFSREDALGIIKKYQNKKTTNHVVDFAWVASEKLCFRLGITEIEAQLFSKLAGCILYSNPRYRAPPGLITKNRNNQSGLWKFGISGDIPLILVRVCDLEQSFFMQQVLQAHAYCRCKGVVFDLVIWNDETTHYRDLLNQTLHHLMSHIPGSTELLHQPGGIHPVRGDSLTSFETVLLYSVARVVLSDNGGSLTDQINRTSKKGLVVPAFQPLAQPRPVKDVLNTVPKLHERDLILRSDVGGFDAKRKEYVMMLGKNHVTPKPWCNVLANDRFGSVISEKGSAYSFFTNAHEYRLTPFNNDAVLDGSGEAFYIRDETTGQYWSPMPQPVIPDRDDYYYICRHGIGYSIWEHFHDGIHTETTTFVPQNEPVKVFLIRVTNNSGYDRNLSVTGFVEWVLGELRELNAPHIITDVERTDNSTAIIARNSFHIHLSHFVGFFSVIGHKEGTLTGDRNEFIGSNGTLDKPQAMRQQYLSGNVGAAFDPCAAIQVPITVEDGKVVEVAFMIGANYSRDGAKDVISRIRSNLIVRQLLNSVKAFWHYTLNTIQVETPNPELDVLANGWLLYQVLSSRIWGRSGFYQSSGAFGFRDQLQDTMAVAFVMPQILKQQILTNCEHQFEKGDVCHWWHDVTNSGVRTTFSDDYLWLPFAVAHYVEITEDYKLLHERIRFSKLREIEPGEESVYDRLEYTEDTASVYEHCKRALKYGFKYGSHGLPLMGCGDWNDGMNLVGIHGKGESVWLAFFLYHVLEKFEQYILQTEIKDDEFLEECRKNREFIKENIEKNAWDGEWYRRAYFDSGEPLGSKENSECQIDSLPQSWAIMSGCVDKKRAKMALTNAYQRLVRHDLKLIQLFDPPLQYQEPSAGYIQGYAPGVRENGGQYTHASIWFVWAYSILKDSKKVWDLFDILNPINHAKTKEDVWKYKVEPYVVTADIYTLMDHEGEGGWSWFTGSGGWFYRLILERLIGIKKQGNSLKFDPCPREDWKKYSITYQHGKTTYQIQVIRSDENHLTVDGVKKTDPTRIPLQDDGKTHKVEIYYKY